MAKTASEVFGHPVDVQTVGALSDRQKRRCPFTGQKCRKTSSFIRGPTGSCSVAFDGDDIALCPDRFLENETVFGDTADSAFGSRHDLLRFEQVKLGEIGNLDYVIVKHRPLSSTIEDFVVVEFQTGQTTNSGGLAQAVKDFRAGKDVRGKNYKFGVNFYDIWKREFTQILFKGMVMEQWGTRIYWVVQTPIFKYLKDKYHLESLTPGRDKHTVFAVYDLNRAGDSLHLTLNGYWSVAMDGLFHDLRRSQPVPSKTEFLGRLKDRVDKELHLKLKIGTTRQLSK